MPGQAGALTHTVQIPVLISVGSGVDQAPLGPLPASPPAHGGQEAAVLCGGGMCG